MQTLTHNTVGVTRMAAIVSPSQPALKDICTKLLLQRPTKHPLVLEGSPCLLSADLEL